MPGDSTDSGQQCAGRNMPCHYDRDRRILLDELGAIRSQQTVILERLAAGQVHIGLHSRVVYGGLATSGLAVVASILALVLK